MTTASGTGDRLREEIAAALGDRASRRDVRGVLRVLLPVIDQKRADGATWDDVADVLYRKRALLRRYTGEYLRKESWKVRCELELGVPADQVDVGTAPARADVRRPPPPHLVKASVPEESVAERVVPQAPPRTAPPPTKVEVKPTSGPAPVAVVSERPAAPPAVAPAAAHAAPASVAVPAAPAAERRASAPNLDELTKGGGRFRDFKFDDEDPFPPARSPLDDFPAVEALASVPSRPPTPMAPAPSRGVGASDAAESAEPVKRAPRIAALM